MAGDPTLVVRLALGPNPYLGRDCTSVAKELCSAEVISAQWSYPPEALVSHPHKWPRPGLNGDQQETVRAVRTALKWGPLPEGAVLDLLAIISDLSGRDA